MRDGTARCPKHKKLEAKAHDARRGSAHERGYSVAWQRARDGFLKSHPLCKKHEEKGERVVAIVVDHVIPHRGDKELFWDHSNWQPMCKSCHDRKTATEDGGGWRR